MSQTKGSSGTVLVRDGISLYYKTVYRQTDIWLICVHGIGEHIGRENHLSDLFSDQYNVVRYDLRGHGKSEGRRGHVGSFSTFYRDLEDLIVHLSSTHPNFRYVLFGHSMGALIAAGFAQDHPPKVPFPERLFLASPPIGIGGRGGAIVNHLPLRLFTWLRKTPFSVSLGSTINRHYLSHENAVATNLKQDPLSLKRLHTKLLFNLVEASRKVFSRPIAAPCPLYCAIGSKDRIVSCLATQRYFETHEPKAELRIIEGAYHELHNESAEYREPYFAFLRQALAVG